MMNDEPHATALSPAALRPELTERFLSAMQAASAEPGLEELEARLRRLTPAPAGSARHRAWLEQMQGATRSHALSRGWGRLSRWGAAAALFVLCTSGSFLMLNSSALATVPSGLACRSVMETNTGDFVQWQEGGQTALRSCDVLYEDSFVLDGEEDCTITVRVPVRAQVMIEEEVI